MLNMTALIPFNRRRNSLLGPSGAFNNMLDDFFTEGSPFGQLISWMPGRNLMRDTFKVDVRETDKEYVIEAEMPGIAKDEIELNLDDSRLTISVNRQEDINEENDGYIHRERRCCSMSRSIHLADCKPDAVKAKLDNGVLVISVDKAERKSGSQRIEIE